ncbi:hypothetical protein CSKR_103669 [Clonorchis sinensis]|uniref:Microtubule-associated protein n=1 Tax=Clonorchis sinensis TaxID=79923 RepID=A0A8T1ML52_CLOSI|nr:hypothetical protein CSKR_103669 [Clonorchis sinensis]
MDASASFIHRPHTLEQAQQHSVSNGFHPNCQQSPSQPITQPCSSSPDQPLRQNLDLVHQPMVSQDISGPISQQQKAEQRLQPSSNASGTSHFSTDSSAPSSTVHPGQTVSSEPVSNNVPHSGLNSPINGVRPSSGIPRLRPSAIPRLLNPRVDDSVHILERASSTGNASPHRTASSYATPCDQPHDGPISLPQTPSGVFTRPFVPLTQSPVEPPSPPNNNQYVGSYYADRSRTSSRSANACRVERTASEHPQRPADNESDTSSAFSSSGTPRLITSKINSLKNVHHKPGGGNVSIVNEKVQLGPIASKCNSFANVKHKPGGGNVVIVDEKLDLTGVHSKISSLKNVKHVPGGGQTQIKNDRLNFSENAAPRIGRLSKMTHTPSGGQVQIVSHKLEFDKTAKSKIGSLKNAQHRAGGGDVQIFREQLPWLKYNKPNLPPEERARINKHRSLSHSEMSNSINSSST